MTRQGKLALRQLSLSMQTCLASPAQASERCSALARLTGVAQYSGPDCMFIVSLLLFVDHFGSDGQEMRITSRRRTRQEEDHIVPASLADQMFDPESGSTSCILFTPASKILATCNMSGCLMNCRIVWRPWKMFANCSRRSAKLWHSKTKCISSP